MAMADKPEELDGLESFFEAARDAAPRPSAALSARILADAAAETARRQTLQAAPVVPARRRGVGFWEALVLGLGGRGALAGLAGAMVAGVWLGVAQPAPIASLAQQVAGDATTLDQVDLMPSIDSYLTQESNP